jgi:hypothetical protein
MCPRDPYALLLFPEGTDLAPRGMAASDAYAAKNGLPPRLQTMYPRSRGFLYSLDTLSDPKQADLPLEQVYDMTVAFKGAIPQVETQLLSGDMPSEVHFHVDSFPLRDLPPVPRGGHAPPEQTEPMTRWLNERFQRKEAALRLFYEHVNTGAPLSLGECLRRADAQLGLQTPASSAPGLDAVTTRLSSFPLPAYVRGAVFALVKIFFAASLFRRYPLFMCAWVVAYHLVYAVVMPRLGLRFDKLEVKFFGDGRRKASEKTAASQ